MWSKLQSSQQVCLNMTEQASGPPEPNKQTCPDPKMQQGTLGVDARCWGPAGNTGRGWSWLRSGKGTLGGDGRGWGPAGNTGRGWSWLRSDREHCASRVAVEEEEERRGGEKQATDIKSNNPHLAGGEIYQNGVQCKSHEKTAAFSRPTVESRVANNCRDHAGSQLQTEKVCGDPWLLWQWQKHLGRTHSERMTAISEDSKN